MTTPFRARRRFGQHFLHDPGVIGRMVSAMGPQSGAVVVEIGPGLGALTGPLLGAVGRLDVVEVDRDLAARLAARFAGEVAAGRLLVHTADALAFDFAALGFSALAGPPDRRLRVVGNLPYNISTPLLFHLLSQSGSIRDMHVMVQREVADRMAAAPGGGDYGRLSVMVQWQCRVERLFHVGPGAFSPPPRVTSSVVRLTVRETPPAVLSEGAPLGPLVARAFSHRRKTLRNALGGVLTAEAMEAAGVDPGARPETLDLLAFARLANGAAHGDGAARGDVLR